MKQKFYRTGVDRVLGGVCGGIANYIDVDPIFIRVGFVVLWFSPIPVGLFYLLMCIFSPTED